MLSGPGALMTAAVLVGACGSAEAPPTTVSATALHDGRISVNLAVATASVAPGDSVAIVVDAVNLGPAAVVWRSGGCDLRGAVRVVALEPPEPTGGFDLGPAESAWVTAVALSAELAAQTSTLAISPGPRRTLDCRLDHGFAELRPGARLTEHAAWRAETATGAPALAGRYRLTAVLEVVRAGVELVPAEFRAGRDVVPAATSVDIVVAEPGPSRLAAAEALALLLRGTLLGDWVRSGDVMAADTTMRYEDGEWLVRVVRRDGITGLGRVAADSRGPARFEVRR